MVITVTHGINKNCPMDFTQQVKKAVDKIMIPMGYSMSSIEEVDDEMELTYISQD